MAPLAYAQMQVVAQAVEATGSFDDTRLSGPDQFKDGSRQVVVSPTTLASGHLIFPYARAL
jgi:branched-chain amino acid transport system substrate-binding protein